jgi:hypothetical protein
MRSIGPELISVASDNDPTNAGTAAAVGAQAGCQLSWLALLAASLLSVVLALAAQIGALALEDFQSHTLKRSGRGVAAVLLMSVVVVNVVTIAADLQAGAAGVGLLADVDSRCLVEPLGRLWQGCCWPAGAARWWRCCGTGCWGSPLSARRCWRIRTGPACWPPAWSRRCRCAPM